MLQRLDWVYQCETWRPAGLRWFYCHGFEVLAGAPAWLEGPTDLLNTVGFQ
jgi:hypothetical protein